MHLGEKPSFRAKNPAKNHNPDQILPPNMYLAMVVAYVIKGAGRFDSFLLKLQEVLTILRKHRGLYISKKVLKTNKNHLKHIFKSISILKYWIMKSKSSNLYSILISRVFYVALFLIFFWTFFDFLTHCGIFVLSRPKNS